MRNGDHKPRLPRPLLVHASELAAIDPFRTANTPYFIIRSFALIATGRLKMVILYIFCVSQFD